jgi:hypothetical protein
MKKSILTTFSILFILTLIQSDLFGQQKLWTSIKERPDTSFKYIPINKVEEKIMEYYELHDYYFDLTGMNKEEFKGKVGNKWWDKINSEIELEKNVYFSMKGNNGNGSIIFVFILSKQKIDIIGFSNQNQDGSIPTYNGVVEGSKERFKKWYRTLVE